MKYKKTTYIVIFIALLLFLISNKFYFSGEILLQNENKTQQTIQESFDQTKTRPFKNDDTRNIQEQFKKCFKKEIKNENIDNITQFLLQQKEYSSAVVNEESYELLTSEKQKIVVQVIPQEEEINKVRVFSISKIDGLPDRIKEFPQSEAAFDLRLRGALSLGTLKSKSISTNQTAYDGSMLSLDKKDEKTVRAHLITNSFEFECKDHSCLCLVKE